MILGWHNSQTSIGLPVISGSFESGKDASSSLGGGWLNLINTNMAFIDISLQKKKKKILELHIMVYILINIQFNKIPGK